MAQIPGERAARPALLVGAFASLLAQPVGAYTLLVNGSSIEAVGDYSNIAGPVSLCIAGLLGWLALRQTK